MIALKNLNSLQIIKRFFESGIDVKDLNNNGDSALFYALKKKQ